MFDLEIEAAVSYVTLNRPEARNAIPSADWPKLGEAVAKAAEQGARLLILQGSGSAFCAGADITDFAAMENDAAAVAAFRASMREALDRLRTLPIPIVALIDGACFGAGVALALACDLRLAGPAATFAITPAKFGISYPQQDVHRLVSLVGPGQAARILFTAGRLDREEAQKIGLVDLPSEALPGLIEAMLANRPESLATLKRGIRLAQAGCASDSEQDERFDVLLSAPALAERLRALRGRLA